MFLQCCVNEDVEVARLLLEHGANVNVQDNDLWTPLHVAAACGTIEIVELLLQVNDFSCCFLYVCVCFNLIFCESKGVWVLSGLMFGNKSQWGYSLL